MLAEQENRNGDEQGMFSAIVERFDTMVASLDTFLRSNFGPPLKALHEPIDAWLGSLPMSVAMACALGLYAIAVIWVWTLPKKFVFRGAPDQRPWRDLRVWATLVTIPYVIIYMWLGR